MPDSQVTWWDSFELRSLKTTNVVNDYHGTHDWLTDDTTQKCDCVGEDVVAVILRQCIQCGTTFTRAQQKEH